MTPNFETLDEVLDLADRMLTPHVTVEVDKWIMSQFERRTEAAQAVAEDPDTMNAVLQITVKYTLNRTTRNLSRWIAQEHLWRDNSIPLLEISKFKGQDNIFITMMQSAIQRELKKRGK